MGAKLVRRVRPTSTNIGTPESAGSLTWEFEAPRIVAFEHVEQSLPIQAPPARVKETPMESRMTHCAGLDVHQKTVVVTVRVPGANGDRYVETRTFATMRHRPSVCSQSRNANRSGVMWPWSSDGRLLAADLLHVG